MSAELGTGPRASHMLGKHVSNCAAFPAWLTASESGPGLQVLGGRHLSVITSLAREIAHRAKALAAKADILSSIPGTHPVGEKI